MYEKKKKKLDKANTFCQSLGPTNESNSFQDLATSVFIHLPTEFGNITDYNLFCKSVRPLL